VGARGQGAPARHDEPHSVHALPPSDPNALPTRPPELPCPLPRVRELVTESQRKAEICAYERSTAGTEACGEPTRRATLPAVARTGTRGSPRSMLAHGGPPGRTRRRSEHRGSWASASRTPAVPG